MTKIHNYLALNKEDYPVSIRCSYFCLPKDQKNSFEISQRIKITYWEQLNPMLKQSWMPAPYFKLLCQPPTGVLQRRETMQWIMTNLLHSECFHYNRSRNTEYIFIQILISFMKLHILEEHLTLWIFYNFSLISVKCIVCC